MRLSHVLMSEEFAAVNSPCNLMLQRMNVWVSSSLSSILYLLFSFYLIPFFLAFALGVTQILAFLDTNMLVSPMQDSRVGDIAQCGGPT